MTMLRSIPCVLCLLLVLGLTAGTAGAQAQDTRKNVAILVFDNAQIIDYAGPYEVFGGLFNVFTVGPTTDPITSVYGLRLVPDYGYDDDYPTPDILVLPGGGRHNPNLEGAWAHALPTPDDAVLFDWVRRSVDEAEHVLTVCNGAFILARAGLLDGLEATTTAYLLAALEEVAPTTRVVRDRRFTDNGKIVTSAGLSAGMDAALHIVAKAFGTGTAQRKALGLEYDWDPDGGWTRAALADRFLLFNFREIDGTSLRRDGDEDRWESTWHVRQPATPEAILAATHATLATSRSALSGVQWTHEADEVSADAATSRWRFTDEAGHPWAGTVHVAPLPKDDGAFLLSVRVEKR